MRLVYFWECPIESIPFRNLFLGGSQTNPSSALTTRAPHTPAGDSKRHHLRVPRSTIDVFNPAQTILSERRGE
jgi:hypothetical protein